MLCTTVPPDRFLLHVGLGAWGGVSVYWRAMAGGVGWHDTRGVGYYFIMGPVDSILNKLHSLGKNSHTKHICVKKAGSVTTSFKY